MASFASDASDASDPSYGGVFRTEENRSKRQRLAFVSRPGDGVAATVSHSRDEGSPETEEDGGDDAQDFDENPYGLNEKAVEWLKAEMKPLRSKINRSEQEEQQQYHPYVSEDGRVADGQFEKAAEEYKLREEADETVSNERNYPVLVALGVSRSWGPDESIAKARFLLFPMSKIGQIGNNEDHSNDITRHINNNRCALFLTYMPGARHGAVDGCFMDDFGSWKRAEQRILGRAVTSGVSSGGKNFPQPDRRVYPRRSHKDPNGNDTDRGNENNPYSRLIWEVEYGNRDPVELRQHGYKMMRSKYTRLFLGAKFSDFDEDGLFEAAIVLWARPDGHTSGDEISVVDAVSFGTKDLSAKTKAEYSEDRSNRLKLVQVNEWRRPTGANGTLGELEEDTPDDWMLNVSHRGILYKVAAIGMDNNDGQFEYLLDVLADGQIRDLRINLRIMADEFQAQRP